ncbi:MAG: hypothetical protein HY069_04955 [Chlamydiia bacterium]|nr:hypothetical protein [Chlamydiia bacterium]
MTKVGDKEHYPKKRASLEMYGEELERHCNKLIQALDQYNVTSDFRSIEHLKSVMDAEMAHIRSIGQEFTGHSFHDQKAKVDKDYRNYLSGKGADAYSALHHDLSTLKDYLRLQK